MARDDGPLRRGRAVYIRHPTPSDADAFIAAVHRSRALHRPWVSPPADAKTFAAFVATADRPQTQRMLVCLQDGGDLVGAANLSQIFYGPFRNAYLGYYAFVPYDGHGLMKDGVRLTLRHAFDGLGLHRIQANVQPENERSIQLLRSLGFAEEGYARRYLKVRGRWRDHLLFAILAEDARRVGSPA
jgi:[ribosomal protein S5]-alanine N-acetyltransferase